MNVKSSSSKPTHRSEALCKLAILLLLAIAATCSVASADDEMRMLQTDKGVRFGIVGEKPAKPAPTLFVLAGTARDALTSKDFFKSGRIVRTKGWICVSLDVPSHGEDARAGESQGIHGWRTRLEKQENPMTSFIERSKGVLDYLVREGFTDPQQVAVAGTSRGGFCAFHLAAAEPRVKWVIAFAPVTELLVVTEFKGLETNELAKSITAARLAPKLTGKPMWVCIGNNDARVGTAECFAFVHAVAQANLAAGKPAAVELHIMPSVGHSIHDTAHDEAAAWLLKLSADR